MPGDFRKIQVAEADLDFDVIVRASTDIPALFNGVPINGLRFAKATLVKRKDRKMEKKEEFGMLHHTGTNAQWRPLNKPSTDPHKSISNQLQPASGQIRSNNTTLPFAIQGTST
jgi:hypothetical protein